MTRDTENNLPTTTPVPGYSSWADFLASDRDHCAAIHRRFGYLAALDLLLYESELSELEKELDTLHKADYAKREDDHGARDFKAFLSQAEDPDSDTFKRWQLLLKIRTVLKQYREAVQFEHLMLSRPNPTGQDYEAIFNKFWNRDKPASYACLGGASTSLYSNADDLISLRPSTQTEDPFSKLLQNRFYLLFQDKQKRCHAKISTDPVIYTSHARIDTFVTILTIALAATFLYGSIWSLYYVQTPVTTLGLLTMWTVLFAVVLASVTNSRRSEIFSACAAYAAVLVVFVSGNAGTSRGS